MRCNTGLIAACLWMACAILGGCGRAEGVPVEGVHAIRGYPAYALVATRVDDDRLRVGEERRDDVSRQAAVEHFAGMIQKIRDELAKPDRAPEYQRVASANFVAMLLNKEVVVYSQEGVDGYAGMVVPTDHMVDTSMNPLDVARLHEISFYPVRIEGPVATVNWTFVRIHASRHAKE